jgi:hypothetical protein
MPVAEEPGPVAPEPGDFAAEPVQSAPPRARHAHSGCPDCDAGGDCDGGPCDGDYEMRCGPLGYPCHPFWRQFHDRFWVRTEYMLWWAQGMSTPPLLTTSPPGQNGVLPEAQVLYGGVPINDGARSGGRIWFGAWFDDCHNAGLDFTYLGFGRTTERFSTNSTGDPLLARPFFDASTGENTSQFVANSNPNNASQGTFTVLASSDFHVAEVLVRRGLARSCNYRVDFLTGYRYQRLNDNLRITNDETGITIPTTFTVVDQFDTRNDFNGAEIGFATEMRRRRWSLETQLKLAIGNTHSRTHIAGSMNITTPAPPVLRPSGLLAQPTNIGDHETNQFSMVPELGFTAGYAITPRLRATLGYTLMYWGNVLRAGDQIDTAIDSRQLSLEAGTFVRPEFPRRVSDFWAQGMNLGLDLRF